MSTGTSDTKGKTLRLFGREIDYKVRRVGDGFVRPGKQQSSLQASRYMSYADSWYFQVLDSPYLIIFRNVLLVYVSLSILFTFITLPLAGKIGLGVHDIELDNISDIRTNDIAANADGDPNIEGKSAMSFDTKFTRSLYFSVTHIITMGYGQFYPYDWERSEPHLGLFFLASFQQFVGLIINVLFFTILVTKVQHAQAAIVFAKRALVTTRNGQRVLLFRIGNLRCNHIYMPSVRLSVLQQQSTREGENYMRWIPLKVTEIPVVTAVAVLEHKITPDSPLSTDFPEGFTKEWVEGLAHNHDLAMSLTFMGTDGVYHDEISSAHRYFRDDIVFGEMRYGDVMEAVFDRTSYASIVSITVFNSLSSIFGKRCASKMMTIWNSIFGQLPLLGPAISFRNIDNECKPKRRVVANFEKLGNMLEFEGAEESDQEIVDDYGDNSYSSKNVGELVDAGMSAFPGGRGAIAASAGAITGAIGSSVANPWGMNTTGGATTIHPGGMTGGGGTVGGTPSAESEDYSIFKGGYEVRRIPSTLSVASRVSLNSLDSHQFGSIGGIQDAADASSMDSYNRLVEGKNPLWSIPGIDDAITTRGSNTGIDLFSPVPTLPGLPSYPMPCEWSMLQAYRELKLGNENGGVPQIGASAGGGFKMSKAHPHIVKNTPFKKRGSMSRKFIV